jgi:Na+/H+ antiporter NhaD/arsenite permease-like protein
MNEVVAGLLFLVTLVVIFSEKMHRTITAVAGAALMVGIGVLMGFYGEEQAIASIDFETLGLLLGMMLMVSLLQPTGFFEYLAIRAAQLSRGKPVLLFILLGSITTVLSMFLDNVTTVVLIAPVTILISEIMGINPVPFLMAEAILSNTGGTGTLVGDPPNVLIGSQAMLTFDDFLANSLPITLVVWVMVLGLLLFLFRRDLSQTPTGMAAVADLSPARALNEPVVARRILLVLGVAILLFFVHHRLQVTPAFIALSAAALSMTWVRPDVRGLFERVEWSVLIFFVALFVMVGGLEASGLLQHTSTVIATFGRAHPAILGVGLLWVVAILSAVVDNIPITIALIPVIEGLGANGINIEPLWWALVFGAGFGGNGTIVGTTANIIVVSLSERTRRPITSAMWLKRGIPVMLLACAIASLLYVLFIAGPGW